MTPWAWPILTPGHDSGPIRIYVGVPLIIATHKILKLLTSWFQRRFFYDCKSMGDDDPRGVANLEPRTMIGRIYVGYH